MLHKKESVACLLACIHHLLQVARGALKHGSFMNGK